MLVYINSNYEVSGLERILKGTVSIDQFTITSDFDEFNLISISKKKGRIYVDRGLKWPVLKFYNDMYVVVGDSHHLPGLLLDAITYIGSYPSIKVYFYGKPTHYRFARLFGIIANPIPIDIFIIEAFSQSKKLNNTRYTKDYLSSVCSTETDHQYKRSQFLRDDQISIDTCHTFLGKEDYLRHLFKAKYYYILSNCLQLNPQLFFALSASTVPILNGIPEIYYEIYPCLYDFPHSSKIINANNFSCSKSQLESVQHNALVNLESLYKTSKGELYWADNFKCENYDQTELNSEDIVHINKHLYFTDPRVSLLFIHEVCQQIVKYSKEDMHFEICEIPAHLNYFIFQDINCFNKKLNKVMINLLYSKKRSCLIFQGTKDCEMQVILLNKSIKQLIRLYQQYCEHELAISLF